jgi:putative ABC transport system ATP-binding protein
MGGYGLRIAGLSKRFPNGGDALVALDGIDLEVPPSQFVVIVGPNGSGKSTLLNLVAGDYPPDRGTIELIDPAQRRGNARTTAPRVGRVLQDPQAGTVPDLTVAEHLRMAICERWPSPLRRALSADDAARCADWLAQIGLQGREGSLAGNLSGGQRQMLTLLLATLRRPSLLILDEHTASLDRRNATACMAATARVSRESLTTVLMVTHDLGDAVRYGDRLLVTVEGRIIADFSGAEKQGLDPSELVRYWEPGRARPRRAPGAPPG